MNPSAPGQQPVADTPVSVGTPPPIVGRDVFPVQQAAASITPATQTPPQNPEDITSDIDVASLSPVSMPTEQSAHAEPAPPVMPPNQSIAAPVSTADTSPHTALVASQPSSAETSKLEHNPHLEFSKIVPEDPKKHSGGGSGLMIFGLVLVLIGSAIIVAGFAGILPKM